MKKSTKEAMKSALLEVDRLMYLTNFNLWRHRVRSGVHKCDWIDSPESENSLNWNKRSDEILKLLYDEPEED